MNRSALEDVLAGTPRRVVACSGGVDSLLLATIAHRADPTGTIVAHTVTPAVPAAATARVVDHAEREGWNLQLVTSTEFEDPRYLQNPVDRCYFCKSHLYDALQDVAGRPGWTVLSGANTDDLGEYRPGLVAAAEHDVRHPYVEAGIDKATIRSIARDLGLPFADIAASPCLASRLYTGTTVTPRRLRAVEVGEDLLRTWTGIEVLRCRVRENEVVVEVPDEVRDRVRPAHLARLLDAMRGIEPGLDACTLDADAYRPGRAFQVVVA